MSATCLHCEGWGCSRCIAARSLDAASACRQAELAAKGIKHAAMASPDRVLRGVLLQLSVAVRAIGEMLR